MPTPYRTTGARVDPRPDPLSASVALVETSQALINQIDESVAKARAAVEHSRSQLRGSLLVLRTEYVPSIRSAGPSDVDLAGTVQASDVGPPLSRGRDRNPAATSTAMRRRPGGSVPGG